MILWRSSNAGRSGAPAVALAGALMAVAGLAGCVSDRYPAGVPLGTPAGIAALGEQIDLGDAPDAYYRWDGPESITAVLVPRGASADDATYASLTVVRVMWRPRAAATPLARTATNAAVRHLVFAGPGDGGDAAAGRGVRPSPEPPGETLGLFTGAGFAGLGGSPAGGVLDLNLREADLRLTDCSAGYTHPLRRAALTARVRAQRDDAAVSRWLKAAGVRASEALGYPAWVRASPREPSMTLDGGPITSSESESESGAERCLLPLSIPPFGA